MFRKSFSFPTAFIILLFLFFSVQFSWGQSDTFKTTETIEPFILKGKIVSLSGTVKFRNTETIIWKNLKLGQELFKNDVIQTEEDGQVAIEFTNGNFLSLKENSRVTISELSVNPKTKKYDMVFDVIEAKLKAEANDHENLERFEVHTLTAVAGVRGTIFFINATQRFTDIFVERGRVSLADAQFSNERDVQAGFAVTADDNGEISEPAIPDPEQMQEFQSFLEPTAREFSSPPLEEQDVSSTEDTEPSMMDESFFQDDSSFLSDFEDTQEEFDEAQLEFFFDILSSQEADKTDYIDNPPDPTGSGSADSDDDGIINSADTDDDNDFLIDTEELSNNTDPLEMDTDSDGLTDWEELRLQSTDPLDSDSDNDTVTDVNDADPNDAAITESRSTGRTYLYNKIDSIPGLHSEISSMLAESGSRQRDYAMDRISDAQIHKVLKDRNNNWVRVEEYVFRPTTSQIDILTLNSRSSAQISSLYFSTIFNTAMNDLTSQEIKDLPWARYLTTGNLTYGATAPAYYPTQMNVKLVSSTNSIEERRTLGSPVFGGPWGQAITSSQLSVDGGAFNNFSTINLISSNPAAFDYNYGSIIDFFVYVVNDTTGALAGGSYSYDSLWSVLGTNLSGHQSIPNGHHLEIYASYNAGPQFINVLYLPMDELLWRGDTNWPQELTW